MDLIFQFVQVVVDFFTTGAVQKAQLNKQREFQNATIQALFDANDQFENALEEAFKAQSQEQIDAATEQRIQQGKISNILIAIIVTVVVVVAVWWFLGNSKKQ